MEPWSPTWTLESGNSNMRFACYVTRQFMIISLLLPLEQVLFIHRLRGTVFWALASVSLRTVAKDLSKSSLMVVEATCPCKQAQTSCRIDRRTALSAPVTGLRLRHHATLCDQGGTVYIQLGHLNSKSLDLSKGVQVQGKLFPRQDCLEARAFLLREPTELAADVS